MQAFHKQPHKMQAFRKQPHKTLKYLFCYKARKTTADDLEV